MKKKIEYNIKHGLPGGANELKVSGAVSVEGYKRNSPDVNNEFNIIQSSNITMKDVDFPLVGIDNLGNKQIMYPGGEYTFPGHTVLEVPLAQSGEETPKGRDGDVYIRDVRSVVEDPLNVTHDLSDVPLHEDHNPSTHYMADDDNLTAWPTLFQDPEGNWYRGGREEAERLGEIYTFDTREEMIAFAREGNWKPKKQEGGQAMHPFEEWASEQGMTAQEALQAISENPGSYDAEIVNLAKEYYIELQHYNPVNDKQDELSWAEQDQYANAELPQAQQGKESKKERRKREKKEQEQLEARVAQGNKRMMQDLEESGLNDVEINTEGLRQPIHLYGDPIQSDWMIENPDENPANIVERNYGADMIEYYDIHNPDSMYNRRRRGEFLGDDIPDYLLEREGWRYDNILQADDSFQTSRPGRGAVETEAEMLKGIHNTTLLPPTEVELMRHKLYADYEEFIANDPNAGLPWNEILDENGEPLYEDAMDFAMNSPSSEYWKRIARFEQIYGMPSGSHTVHANFTSEHPGYLDRVKQYLRDRGEDPDDYKYRNLLNYIIMNPEQIRGQSIESGVPYEDEYRSTLAHEYGHLGYSDHLSDRDQIILNYLNRADENLKHDHEVTGHHNKTTEIHADLMAVRQDMLDKGIYDYKEGNMTPEQWEEYLNTYEEGKYPLTLQRTIDRYRIPDAENPDKNIQYINNAVAFEDELNDDVDNFGYAQRGGSLSQFAGGGGYDFMMQKQTQRDLGISDEDLKDNRTTSEKLDHLQTMLAAGGLTPAYGIVPDLVNTAISGGRGFYSWLTGDKDGTTKHMENMAINATSAVPGPVGWTAGGAGLAKDMATYTGLREDESMYKSVENFVQNNETPEDDAGEMLTLAEIEKPKNNIEELPEAQRGYEIVTKHQTAQDLGLTSKGNPSENERTYDKRFPGMYDNTLKSFQKIVENEPPEIQQLLYNAWKNVGRPPIKKQKNNRQAANYNFITGIQAYDSRDLMEEFGHAYQVYGDRREETDFWNAPLARPGYNISSFFPNLIHSVKGAPYQLFGRSDFGLGQYIGTGLWDWVDDNITDLDQLSPYKNIHSIEGVHKIPGATGYNWLDGLRTTYDYLKNYSDPMDPLYMDPNEWNKMHTNREILTTNQLDLINKDLIDQTLKNLGVKRSDLTGKELWKYNPNWEPHTGGRWSNNVMTYSISPTQRSYLDKMGISPEDDLNRYYDLNYWGINPSDYIMVDDFTEDNPHEYGTDKYWEWKKRKRQNTLYKKYGGTLAQDGLETIEVGNKTYPISHYNEEGVPMVETDYGSRAHRDLYNQIYELDQVDLIDRDPVLEYAEYLRNKTGKDVDWMGIPFERSNKNTAYLRRQQLTNPVFNAVVDPLYGNIGGLQATDRMSELGFKSTPYLVTGAAAGPLGAARLLRGAGALLKTPIPYTGTTVGGGLNLWGGYHGAKNITPHVGRFMENPSWRDAGNISLDLLGIGAGIYSGAGVVNKASQFLKPVPKYRPAPGIDPLNRKHIKEMMDGPDWDKHMRVMFNDMVPPSNITNRNVWLQNRIKEMRNNPEAIKRIKNLINDAHKRAAHVASEGDVYFYAPLSKEELNILTSRYFQAISKLKIVDDPKTIGVAKGAGETPGYLLADPGNIAIHPGTKATTFKPIANHEVGHHMQSIINSLVGTKVVPNITHGSKTGNWILSVDEGLGGLKTKLPETKPKPDFKFGRDKAIPQEEARLISSKLTTRGSKDFQRATDYFYYDREKLPFLMELQEKMLNTGYIPNRYTKITPKMVKDFHKWYDPNKAGYEIRILDIMEESKDNYTLLSDMLNKIPAIVPPAIIAGGYSATENPEYQTGGQTYGPSTLEDTFIDEDDDGVPVGIDIYDKPYEVLFEDLEKGIRWAESKDGELMRNEQENSTATGLYGQNFSQIEKGNKKNIGIVYPGTRDDFEKDIKYQKELFKDLAHKESGLIDNGRDLFEEYVNQIPDLPYNALEIGALSNMLGRQGTRKYLGYVLRDGRSLAEVFPSLYGPEKIVTNKTPEVYIEEFNEGVLKLKKGGDPIKRRKRLWQQLKKHRKGEKISGLAKLELKNKGLIKEEKKNLNLRNINGDGDITFGFEYDFKNTNLKKVSRGGESDLTLNQQIKFYEDYVNSMYDGTRNFKKAKSLFEKINRFYLLDAKKDNTHVLKHMKKLRKAQLGFEVPTWMNPYNYEGWFDMYPTIKADNFQDAFTTAQKDHSDSEYFLYKGKRYINELKGESKHHQPTQDVLDRIQNSEVLDQNVKDNFMNLWNDLNQPYLNIGDNPLGPKNRDHVDSWSKGRPNLYIKDYTWHRRDDKQLVLDIINELTHVQQHNEMGRLPYVKQYLKELVSAGGHQHDLYDIDNTLEYQAHAGDMRPALETYVFGKPISVIGSRTNADVAPYQIDPEKVDAADPNMVKAGVLWPWGNAVRGLFPGKKDNGDDEPKAQDGMETKFDMLYTVPKLNEEGHDITYNEFKNITPSDLTWSDIGHGALDIFGLVPGLGEPFDYLNALWYGAEGDELNAALSAGATAPFAGWLATAGKWGNKLIPSKAYKKMFSDRTVPIRGGKMFDDGIAEYNSLLSMHKLYPNRFAEPLELIMKDGKPVGYSMKNIDGTNLHTWSKNNKFTQDMYDEISETITDLNSKGLYHGDLNAQNIIIDNKGQWKIIDPVGFEHSDKISKEILNEIQNLDSKSLKNLEGLINKESGGELPKAQTGYGDILQYNQQLREGSNYDPVESAPLFPISHLLDVASIPSALVAEGVEGVFNKGDKEFDFKGALPAFAGNLSFMSMDEGAPMKTVSEVTMPDAHWTKKLVVDIFTDPATWIGAGIARNMSKKAAELAGRLTAKELDKVVLKSLNPVLDSPTTIKNIPEKELATNINKIKTLDEKAKDFVQKEIIDKSQKNKQLRVFKIDDSTGEIWTHAGKMDGTYYNRIKLNPEEKTLFKNHLFNLAKKDGIFKPNIYKAFAPHVTYTNFPSPGGMTHLHRNWFYNPVTKKMQSKESVRWPNHPGYKKNTVGHPAETFDQQQRNLKRELMRQEAVNGKYKILGYDMLVRHRFITTLQDKGIDIITGKELKTMFPEGFYHGSPHRINNLDELILNPKSTKWSSSLGTQPGGFFSTSNPNYARQYMNWSSKMDLHKHANPKYNFYGKDFNWWDINPIDKKPFGLSKNRTMHVLDIADDAKVYIGPMRLNTMEKGYDVMKETLKKNKIKDVDLVFNFGYRSHGTGSTFLTNELAVLNKKGLNKITPYKPTTKKLGKGTQLDDIINIDPEIQKLLSNMDNVSPRQLSTKIEKQLVKNYDNAGDNIMQQYLHTYRLYNHPFSGFGATIDDVPKNKFGIDLLSRPTQTHGWYDEGGEY